jgi:hypothetical protein
MTAHARSVVIGVIVPLLIALVGLIVMVASLPQLPSPVAVHWGPSGAPDQFGSPVGGLILVTVIALGWSAFAFVIARPLAGREYPTFNQRLVLSVGPFTVTLLTVLMAGSLLGQRGLADAHSGPSLVPVLVTAIVAALVLGWAAWFALPAHAARQEDSTPEPGAFDLSANERVVWTQHLQVSRRMSVGLVGILVVALVGGGIVMWLAAPTWVFVLWVVLYAVIIVGVVGTLSWRVTIDDRGLVARSVFGYPRFAIPVSEVASARSVTTDALREFGGYGIRWAGTGRWGLVTRSGEALEVSRTGGRSLTITVSQASAAAALLNSLVARQEAR